MIALICNKCSRFIYVETAFFWMWWKKQTKKVHRLVRRLVREGRLEFIGGAWSMHDEAATHYQSIIDEFTWGFRSVMCSTYIGYWIMNNTP